MKKMVRIDYYSYTEYDIILLLLETGGFDVKTLYKIMKVIIERNYLSAYHRLMNMYRESNLHHRSTLGLFGMRTNYDICPTLEIVMKLDNNYCLRRICKLGRIDMFSNIPKVYMSVRMAFHCTKLISSYYWYIAVTKLMSCVIELLGLNKDYRTDIINCYANISQLLTRRRKHQYINILRVYMHNIIQDNYEEETTYVEDNYY